MLGEKKEAVFSYTRKSDPMIKAVFANLLIYGGL